MAYDVEFTVPSRKLGKADVEFTIKSDGEMLGTLKVSKGSIVWFPTKTSFGYKTTWKQFDSLIQNNVTGEEKR